MPPSDLSQRVKCRLYCLIKDVGQEDGTANSEHGEEEMEVESEKEEEKPKPGGAFSSALSSLNVLRPGWLS